MRLQTERAFAARPLRLPVLQSSNVHLETMLGCDEMIDYTDYLGAPQDPYIMGDVHIMTEHRLGM